MSLRAHYLKRILHQSAKWTSAILHNRSVVLEFLNETKQRKGI